MTPARALTWTALLLSLGIPGCDDPLPPPLGRPQTVVLFSTPKIIRDFSNPAADAAAFLDHYRPLTTRADKTILIFAVGNSQHILTYRGVGFWSDTAEWARWTGVEEFSSQVLDYNEIAAIVQAFKSHAAATGINLEVYDQVDGGVEFGREYFRLNYHTECTDKPFGDSYDIRGTLRYDPYLRTASAPDGIAAGTNCGRYLVDQVGIYMRDLGFDGILYGNQLGTRGRWLPGAGPGYTDEEAAAIRDFMQYSRSVYGDRGLIWFDSYNNTGIERDDFSFPSEAYQNFDYLLAAGFCVITSTERYQDNLRSKLAIPGGPPVLATLDYVDPWYDYNSMTAFPLESTMLENIAILHRHQVDGIVFFANDHHGNPVPRERIERFAEYFFGAD